MLFICVKTALLKQVADCKIILDDEKKSVSHEVLILLFESVLGYKIKISTSSIVSVNRKDKEKKSYKDNKATINSLLIVS